MKTIPAFSLTVLLLACVAGLAQSADTRKKEVGSVTFCCEAVGISLEKVSIAAMPSYMVSGMPELSAWASDRVELSAMANQYTIKPREGFSLFYVTYPADGRLVPYSAKGTAIPALDRGKEGDKLTWMILLIENKETVTFNSGDSSKESGQQSPKPKGAAPVPGKADRVADVQAIKPGDKVRVINGPAPVKVGEKTVTTVETGTLLEVLEVQGDWVKVKATKDGWVYTGWIKAGKHLEGVPVEVPKETMPEPQKSGNRTGGDAKPPVDDKRRSVSPEQACIALTDRLIAGDLSLFRDEMSKLAESVNATGKAKTVSVPVEVMTGADFKRLVEPKFGDPDRITEDTIPGYSTATGPLTGKVTLQPDEVSPSQAGNCVAQPPSAVRSESPRAPRHSRGRRCHTHFIRLKCYEKTNSAMAKIRTFVGSHCR